MKTKNEKYIVVKDGKVIRGTSKAGIASAATYILAPNNEEGELLYVRVGNQHLKDDPNTNND